MKHALIAVLAILSSAGAAGAAPAKQYTGPIIDTHAHIRLGDDDGITR